MKILVKNSIEYMPGCFAIPGQTMEVDNAYGRQLIEDGDAVIYIEGRGKQGLIAGVADLLNSLEAPKTVSTQKAAKSRPGETATEL